MTEISSKLLPVCSDGKYGYITLRGEIVVPCQYDCASDFSEGLATIRPRFNADDYEKQEYIVINAEMTEVGRLECAYCEVFSEGLMAFERHNKRGYVDTSLQVVIPPSFDNAGEFNDGLARAWISWKSGIINRSGDWTIAPKYHTIWPFRKGESVTGVLPEPDKAGWGLLDRRGNTVVEPRFAFLRPTSMGLTPAAIRTGIGKDIKYGFIDDYGEWVVTPSFDNCDGTFVNNTLGVAAGARWGLVNREGAWIIEPRFTFAEAFRDSLSRVYVGGTYDDDSGYSGGKCGYIDQDGEFAVEPRFDDAWPFVDGVAKIELIESDWEQGSKRRIGYINKKGDYIWEPTR